MLQVAVGLCAYLHAREWVSNWVALLHVQAHIQVLDKNMSAAIEDGRREVQRVKQKVSAGGVEGKLAADRKFWNINLPNSLQ